jgi:hypothetical protein
MLRVAGEQLKDNLTRGGSNLTFDNDLFHLDVINGRIGVKTLSPDVEFDVNGAVKSHKFIVADPSVSNNYDIVVNTDGDLQVLYNDVSHYVFQKDGTVIDPNGEILNALGNLKDVDITSAATTQHLILSSDGDDSYSFVNFETIPLNSLTVASDISVGNVTIGVDSPNTIGTSTGNLVIRSSDGDITVDSSATVNGTLTTNGDLITNNALTVGTNATIAGNLTTIGSTSTANLVLGNATPTTISTTLGNIKLVSASGITQIAGALFVDNIRSADNTYITDTQPAIPRDGNFWFDTQSGRLYVYADGQWIQPSYLPIIPGGAGPDPTPSTLASATYVQPNAPVAALEGSLWLSTETGKLYINVDHQWVQPSYELISGAKEAASISENPPSGPMPGEFWFNTQNAKLYVFTHQQQWVQPNYASEELSYSDDRLKTKTGLISNTLDIIKNLDTFKFTPNETATQLGIPNRGEEIGVSAQQIQSVYPEIVKKSIVDITSDGTSKSGEDYLSVDYPKLSVVLLQTCKDLLTKLENLEAEFIAFKNDCM